MIKIVETDDQERLDKGEPKVEAKPTREILDHEFVKTRKMASTLTADGPCQFGPTR